MATLMHRSLKLLRAAAGYAALALAVSVGGVVVGAAVVAPAVARTNGVLTSFRLGIAGVPRLGWMGIDALLVLAAAFYWFARRRTLRNTSAGSDLARLTAAAVPGRLTSSRLTPSRLVTGRSSRTPKAVAALAEAGAAPADIARRTGLALDAVAMLLSLASFGGRQLQPPTA